MKADPTLEQVIEASGNGLIATDADGRVVLLNRRCKVILGLGRRKALGAHVSDILPTIGPLFMKCLRTGESETGHHHPGKIANLVLNITPIRERGEILGSVCDVIEVGDLGISPKGLESYNRLNKQWNTIFKSSSDGILVCDGKGNIITMNEASEKLNGLRAEEVVGKSVDEFVKRGIFDRSVTREVLETKRHVSILQYIQRTGKYLLVTGTPAFGEEGNIFLVVVNERDMTQLNAMREQLEQTRMVTEKFREELAELNMLQLKEQEISVESEDMAQVLRVCLKLARIGVSNILILGESGTGKGLLAKFIHKNSKRRHKPFIQINCAALPESLLEAELFGYQKGAFTGAREEGKVGLFELAQDGTLFLDEIGDLPLSVQAKLLKYLDDNEILPLGGTRPRKVDCVVIAATNRDLDTLRRTRGFREDLFFRLNTFPVKVPPLRERPEDVFGLANYFLGKYNKTYRLNRKISQRAMATLQSYPFPGNVRELKNLVKKAVVMSDHEKLDDAILGSLEGSNWLPRSPRVGMGGRLSLPEEMIAAEKSILKEALQRCRSTREIANYLGVSQPTVVRKIRKHALSVTAIHK
jgi:PAS domain S-box-containing protein